MRLTNVEGSKVCWFVFLLLNVFRVEIYQASNKLRVRSKIMSQDKQELCQVLLSISDAAAFST